MSLKVMSGKLIYQCDGRSSRVTFNNNNICSKVCRLVSLLFFVSLLNNISLLRAQSFFCETYNYTITTVIIVNIKRYVTAKVIPRTECSSISVVI